jgi:hypothetical protein
MPIRRNRSSRTPAPCRGAIITALALALLTPLLTAPVQAQPLAPVPRARIVSINPILLVFGGIVAADYEQRVSTSNTLGVSLSSFSWSDADYLSIEARGRYYVSGRALDGLSVGVVAGLVRLRADDSSRVTDYAMNVGFLGEHQWLLGMEERVAVSAGVGATRLFFNEDRDPFRRVLPIFRLSVGWGF